MSLPPTRRRPALARWWPLCWRALFALAILLGGRTFYTDQFALAERPPQGAYAGILWHAEDYAQRRLTWEDAAAPFRPFHEGKPVKVFRKPMLLQDDYTFRCTISYLAWPARVNFDPVTPPVNLASLQQEYAGMVVWGIPVPPELPAKTRFGPEVEIVYFRPPTP